MSSTTRIPRQPPICRPNATYHHDRRHRFRRLETFRSEIRAQSVALASHVSNMYFLRQKARRAASWTQFWSPIELPTYSMVLMCLCTSPIKVSAGFLEARNGMADIANPDLERVYNFPNIYIIFIFHFDFSLHILPGRLPRQTTPIEHIKVGGDKSNVFAKSARPKSATDRGSPGHPSNTTYFCTPTNPATRYTLSRFGRPTSMHMSCFPRLSRGEPIKASRRGRFSDFLSLFRFFALEKLISPRCVPDVSRPFSYVIPCMESSGLSDVPHKINTFLMVGRSGNFWPKPHFSKRRQACRAAPGLQN